MYKEFFGLEENRSHLRPTRVLSCLRRVTTKFWQAFITVWKMQRLDRFDRRSRNGKNNSAALDFAPVGFERFAAYIFNPRLSIDEFYHHVTQMLGIKDWSNKAELLIGNGQNFGRTPSPRTSHRFDN